MTRLLLATCALSLLATGCARVEEIDADTLARELDAINNAPGPEDIAATLPVPAATIGSWQVDNAAGSALWSSNDAPLFAVRCDRSAGLLLMTRFTEMAGSGAGTLSFTGNRTSASLPVVASEQADGTGTRWQASLTGGALTDNIVEVFGGNEAVDITLTGAPRISVESDNAVRAIVQGCVSSERETLPEMVGDDSQAPTPNLVNEPTG